MPGIHPLIGEGIKASIESAVTRHLAQRWGLLDLDHGCVLLMEALPERIPAAHTADDWRSIGHALGALHQVHAERFGLDLFDAFFGPLRQNNQPVRLRGTS